MSHECIQERRLDRVETDFREHEKTSIPIRDTVNRTATESIHNAADITFLKEQARTHKREWQTDSECLRNEFIAIVRRLEIMLLGDGTPQNPGVVRMTQENSIWINEQKASGNFKFNAIFNSILCITAGVTTAMILRLIK